MTDDDYVERATKLEARDAPSGQRLDGSETFSEYYDRLSAVNSLRWNGKWRDESTERSIDNSAILDSIAGQLSLTDYQHDEAARVFSRLPESLHQGREKPLLAACVCAIIAVRDGRTYHPHNIRSETDTEFSELITELGYSARETYRCWCDVKEEVE